MRICVVAFPTGRLVAKEKMNNKKNCPRSSKLVRDCDDRLGCNLQQSVINGYADVLTNMVLVSMEKDYPNFGTPSGINTDCPNTI